MSCQKCGSTDTYCGCDEATAIAERDAALAKLAALKKRLADAPQTIAHVHRDGSMHGCFGHGGPDFGVCMVAIVRLTEEDA